jgi:DNA modification methylase
MKPYFQDSHTTLYQGNSIDVLAQLPENSVQMCVTSPPYWGLRRYAGEQEIQWADGTQVAYGMESTIQDYVSHTVEVLNAIKMVLKPDGIVFFNLGDSYYNYRPGKGQALVKQTVARTNQDMPEQCPRRVLLQDGLKEKDMCLIPQRVAIAAQEAGWWVRSDIIWSKSNPMPESVKDRPTDAYEHILMLTKSARYYYDAEAVKEPMAEASLARYKYAFGGAKNEHLAVTDNQTAVVGTREPTNGRNFRNVWNINTQPYRKAHFATFPEKIPETCIKAATHEGDTVLDPFGGSGTTGWVAKRLGRKAILIEISHEYCELIVDRCRQAVME